MENLTTYPKVILSGGRIHRGDFLLSFFAGIKVPSFSKDWAYNLADFGLDTIPKILNASWDDFEEAGLQAIEAQRLQEDLIKCLKSINIVGLMISSGLFSGNRKEITYIISCCPTILQEKLDIPDIANRILDAESKISTKKALDFAKSLSMFRYFLKELTDAGVIFDIDFSIPHKTRFLGEHFSFLDLPERDKDLENKLLYLGASSSRRVTEDTTYIVLLEKDQELISLAKEINCPVILYEVFIKKINDTLLIIKNNFEKTNPEPTEGQGTPTQEAPTT